MLLLNTGLFWLKDNAYFCQYYSTTAMPCSLWLEVWREPSKAAKMLQSAHREWGKVSPALMLVRLSKGQGRGVPLRQPEKQMIEAVFWEETTQISAWGLGRDMLRRGEDQRVWGHEGKWGGEVAFCTRATRPGKKGGELDLAAESHFWLHFHRSSYFYM